MKMELITIQTITYSRTLMARILEGLMKIVRAREVNYVQTSVKGHQKGFETFMVSEPFAVQLYNKYYSITGI